MLDFGHKRDHANKRHGLYCCGTRVMAANVCQRNGGIGFIALTYSPKTKKGLAVRCHEGSEERLQKVLNCFFYSEQSADSLKVSFGLDNMSQNDANNIAKLWEGTIFERRHNLVESERALTDMIRDTVVNHAHEVNKSTTAFVYTNLRTAVSKTGQEECLFYVDTEKDDICVRGWTGGKDSLRRILL